MKSLQMALPLNKPIWLLIPLLLFISIFISFGCACNDESNDSEDKNPPITNDDDSDDDSSDDDDSNDDDSDDDNSDDDDNDDDDDDDNVIPYPQDDGTWYQDMFFQTLAGGSPGNDGLDIEVASDGAILIMAPLDSNLYLYTVDTSGTITREKVGLFGYFPDFEIDSNGFIHAVYWSS